MTSENWLSAPKAPRVAGVAISPRYMGVTTDAAFSRGRCQDAFACTFVVQVPAEGPFSVSLYDVDLSQHDAIGACMISGRGQRRCGAATVTSF